MEILIPGLILVALMVYASTRIKRTAAAAFDPETIETDDFVIQKPQGFLHNLNGDPRYLFEAYSKGFGKETTDVRAGRVTVEKKTGTIADAVRGIDESGSEITDDLSEVIGKHHYRVIETNRTEKTAQCRVTYKIVEDHGETFVLEAVVLDEASEELAATTGAFVASFELK